MFFTIINRSDQAFEVAFMCSKKANERFQSSSCSAEFTWSLVPFFAEFLVFRLRSGSGSSVGCFLVSSSDICLSMSKQVIPQPPTIQYTYMSPDFNFFCLFL